MPTSRQQQRETPTFGKYLAAKAALCALGEHHDTFGQVDESASRYLVLLPPDSLPSPADLAAAIPLLVAGIVEHTISPLLASEHELEFYERLDGAFQNFVQRSTAIALLLEDSSHAPVHQPSPGSAEQQAIQTVERMFTKTEVRRLESALATLRASRDLTTRLDNLEPMDRESERRLCARYHHSRALASLAVICLACALVVDGVTTRGLRCSLELISHAAESAHDSVCEALAIRNVDVPGKYVTDFENYVAPVVVHKSYTANVQSAPVREYSWDD